MATRATKRRGSTEDVPVPNSSAPIRTAIVAGGGPIPHMVAKTLSEGGGEPFLVMLKGEADPVLSRYPHMNISTASIGKLIAELKSRKIEQLVMVGTINKRPQWSDFRPDLTTLRLLTRIIRGMNSGDDNLLRLVVKAIEGAGVKVVGVHEILPQMLASTGLIAGRKPSATVMSSVKLGADAASRLGALDAGQGVVVLGNRIIALEGAEGTDQMLQRVADLRSEGRIPRRKGGVLVKVCKPQQDKRVDMPTIGVQTVKNASKAGLIGIAVQAESTLINDVEKVRDEAERSEIFVLGINVDEMAVS